MKLYDYFRSTASYRVRIALALKNVSNECYSIHLLNNGGEQHHESYREINPQGLVPALDVGSTILNQSMAILEFLDESYPAPSLLPEHPIERAQARSIANIITCDIHPLNNLRVLQYLKSELNVSEQQSLSWYHHWLKIGFDAVEKKLSQLDRTKTVCLGNGITLADICLIPQVYNANRFKFPLDDYKLIRNINDYCLSLEAFSKTAP